MHRRRAVTLPVLFSHEGCECRKILTNVHDLFFHDHSLTSCSRVSSNKNDSQRAILKVLCFAPAGFWLFPKGWGSKFKVTYIEIQGIQNTHHPPDSFAQTCSGCAPCNNASWPTHPPARMKTRTVVLAGMTAIPIDTHT
eukprot:COSAG01_NODE_28746_length_653_cov_9.277926_1_plen_138_part_10